MMSTVLLTVGALAVGIALGLALMKLHCRLQAQGKRSKSRNGQGQPAADEKKKPETMKLVIWGCVINGFAWVWCSYLLAWLDKPQIAESLSQVAVTEIIGVVLAYAIKSAVENLSKNNRWPDGRKGDPPDGQTG